MSNNYLNQLKKEISRLPKATQKQILSDYQSYTEEADLSGKPESDIAREFGVPREIALSYIKDEFKNPL